MPEHVYKHLLVLLNSDLSTRLLSCEWRIFENNVKHKIKKASFNLSAAHDAHDICSYIFHVDDG